MSGKIRNFDDKKIKRSTFHKNKAINNIGDIDVNVIYQFLKENHTVQKILFNTLLDITLMMLLDRYV